MRLIAKVTRISHAKCHCNRLNNSCTSYSRLCESHFFLGGGHIVGMYSLCQVGLHRIKY